MSLVHFVSRGLLAGYFVVDGLSTAINPDRLAPVIEPVVEDLTNRVRRLLPQEVSDKVEVKTATLVRLYGLVQATGGLMLATGVFRRGGAAVMAAAYLPTALMAFRRQSPDKLAAPRELALLGGALIAARDTQGKPSLRWLASHRQAGKPRKELAGVATK